MSHLAIIGIVVFLIMMVLIFIGVPVFISMLTCAAFGFMWATGWDTTVMVTKFRTAPFDLAAN